MNPSPGPIIFRSLSRHPNRGGQEITWLCTKRAKHRQPPPAKCGIGFMAPRSNERAFGIHLRLADWWIYWTRGVGCDCLRFDSLFSYCIMYGWFGSAWTMMMIRMYNIFRCTLDVHLASWWLLWAYCAAPGGVSIGLFCAAVCLPDQNEMFINRFNVFVWTRAHSISSTTTTIIGPVSIRTRGSRLSSMHIDRTPWVSIDSIENWQFNN